MKLSDRLRAYCGAISNENELKVGPLMCRDAMFEAAAYLDIVEGALDYASKHPVLAKKSVAKALIMLRRNL